MKTKLSLFLLLLALSLTAPAGLRQASTPAPGAIPEGLAFHVVAEFDYESFDACLRQLEKTTGCKVECRPDIEPFIRQLWADGHVPWLHQPTLTRYPAPVTQYLEAVSHDLGLAWKFDAPGKSILLDATWRRSDSRTEAELLQFVRKEGRDETLERNAAWQDAFNALLSKPGNFAKAAPACQESMAHNFSFLLGRPNMPPWKIILRAPVVDTAGNHDVLFAAYRQQIYSSGGGLVSYFWFKEDGSLMGGGVMETGHHLQFTSAQVKPGAMEPREQPSEIQLDISNMTAHFLLQSEGLRLIHLSDVFNDEIVNHYNIGGNVLLPPKAHLEESAARRSSYTLEFPQDIDTQSLTVACYQSRPMRPSDFGLSKLNLHEKISGSSCTIETTDATHLRAIVFGPRYQTALIDVPLAEKGGAVSKTIELQPQPAVPFTGRIEFPEGADPAQYSLEAVYYGRWAQDYLDEWGETRAPHFSAATIDLHADGSFATKLPDLLHDPAANQHPEETAFTLILHDKKTSHIPYDLKVEGTNGSDVRTAASYNDVKIRAIAWGE